MNDERKDTITSDAALEDKSGVDQGRRRFGKLGAAGTATVLTVTSRSAVAGWGQCTGSEIASGNLSRAGSPNPCGCSPGFWWGPTGRTLWSNLYASEPSRYPAWDATFKSIFGDFYTNPDVQLKDVGPSAHLTNKYGANKNQPYGMHAVAAYLNVLYYGDRYPLFANSPAAVIAAFAACTSEAALEAFLSTVDIYKSGVWCQGKDHS